MRNKISYDLECETVTFTLMSAHGEVDSITLHTQEVTDKELRTQLFLYGCQKLMADRTSQILDKKEKLAAMWDEWMDTVAHPETPRWKAPKEAGGVRSVAIDVEAVARVSGASIAQIQAKKKAMAADDWTKVISNARIKAAMAAIQVERDGATDVDLSEFLAE